jgi:hypothetical protein
MSSEISTIEESIKIALDAADAATDITSEYNEINKNNKKLESEVKKIYMYTTIIFGSSIVAALASILFSAFIYFKSMSDLEVMITTNREALLIFAQNVDDLKETTSEFNRAVSLQEEVKAQNSAIESSFSSFGDTTKEVVTNISKSNELAVNSIVDSNKEISALFSEMISNYEQLQNESSDVFFKKLNSANSDLIKKIKVPNKTDQKMEQLVSSHKELKEVIDILQKRNKAIIDFVKDKEELVKYP